MWDMSGGYIRSSSERYYSWPPFWNWSWHFFNGFLAEIICSYICIYLEFPTRRCCYSWNSGEFQKNHSLLLEWKIVLFRIDYFVKIFCMVITFLIFCSFVWLLLFVCATILVFYYLLSFYIKFYSIKLLISQ